MRIDYFSLTSIIAFLSPKPCMSQYDACNMAFMMPLHSDSLFIIVIAAEKKLIEDIWYFYY